jgi:threonine synthase
MMRIHQETGLVIDPHSATAVSVAEGHLDPAVPMVTLATAHPAKFPDAVLAATGVAPALPLHLGDMMSRPERQSAVANDLSAVEGFIEARARAVRVTS